MSDEERPCGTIEEGMELLVEGERRKTGGCIRGGRVESGFRGVYLYNV